MIRKAAKIAVGIAIGTAIGGCILPRIIVRELIDDTWPPVWKEALLYFTTGFIAAFSVTVLIYRIKENRNKSNHQLDPSRMNARRTVFTSELPADINWNEINFYGLRPCDMLERWIFP